MTAMNGQAAARMRYLADQVSTASPAALIVMLYDRLSLDIEVAATARDAADPIAAALALSHGQQIVTELLTSLDRTVWTGAEDLADLYRYLLMGLIEARTAPDARRLRALGVIVGDLRSAWSQAATALTATALTATASKATASKATASKATPSAGDAAGESAGLARVG
jgi:flagellar secretion chaperone FliS